jgi:hypothetical protein
MMVKATGRKSELPKQAKAQSAIVHHLQNQESFVSVNSLNEFSSNPANVCRKLIEKNLIEMKEKPIIPDLTEFSFKPIHKNIRFTNFQIRLSIKYVKGLIKTNLILFYCMA